jgi:hypothetical protein
MTTTNLEERLPTTLWRLADEVAAPPTDAAMQRVHRRTATLRRRRRTRRAAVGTLLIASVLGTGLWLRTDDRDDLQTRDFAEAPASPAQWNGEWEPPEGAPDQIPALTLEAAGFRPVSAEDEVDLSDEWPLDNRLQAFRRPEDYTGPTVHVSVTVDPRVRRCGDPVGPDVETVDVNGHAAGLREGPSGRSSSSICWQGDAQGAGEVSIMGRGLTADELVAFARGLRPRTDGVGFDATVLPQGIVEDPVDDPSVNPDRGRQITFRDDEGIEVQMTIVHNAGQTIFEQATGLSIDEGSSRVQLVVAGRPAVLTNPPEGPWDLLWRLTTIDYARVTISRGDAPEDDDGSMEPDRATVGAIVAGIRQIDESEWQSLIADLAEEAP